MHCPDRWMSLNMKVLSLEKNDNGTHKANPCSNAGVFLLILCLPFPLLLLRGCFCMNELHECLLHPFCNAYICSLLHKQDIIGPYFLRAVRIWQLWVLWSCCTEEGSFTRFFFRLGRASNVFFSLGFFLFMCDFFTDIGLHPFLLLVL